MGKLSRTKGHDFEREIAQRLRVIFPGARRQLEYSEADCNGIDLADTGHYRIQCKRMKRYVNPSVIAEVQIRNPAEIPVLITKADKKPALAVLPLDALVDLIANKEKHKARVEEEARAV